MRAKDKFGRKTFLADERECAESMMGKRHTLYENFKVQCHWKRLGNV